MITNDSVEIPDAMLIGVTRGQWPITLLYDDRRQAADWLAAGSDAANRRVFRVRLEVVEQLVRIPPVEARLESRPVQLIRENQSDTEARQPEPAGDGPFGPTVDPCPDCGCSKAWHTQAGCSGDFCHCPCKKQWPASQATQSPEVAS